MTRSSYSAIKGDCILPLNPLLVNKMKRIGTNHFATHGQVGAYYFNYGFSWKDWQEKIKNGEVCVGKPEIKEGETLKIDKDGRYWIISK